jgi:hypothetical protein
MSAPLPSTLVLLVYGLPGAGKTTCVRSAAAVLSGRGYQASVIELDHWLHGALGRHADGVEAETKRTFDPDDWHSAFDHYLGGIAAALAEHAAERNNGRPRLVFCVDNHYYRSMRWRVMRAVELANDRAEGTTVGFASVLVDAHTGVCLSRNACRDGVARVPPSVIERMDSRLERGPVKRQPPCTDVTYDATAKSEVPVGLAFANFIEGSALPEALQFAPQRPPRPDPENAPTAASQLHRFDLALRELTRDTVAAARAASAVSADGCKALALNLSRLKASAQVEARSVAAAVAEAAAEAEVLDALIDRVRTRYDAALAAVAT